MDWSTFDDAPHRWKPYVMKVNQHLFGHTRNFPADIYSQPQTVEKIKTYLNTIQGRTGELSLSTKKTYVSAISSFLVIAKIDNKLYRELILHLSGQIKLNPTAQLVPDESISSQELQAAIQSPKTHFHVKLMIGVLYFGYFKQIKLIDLIHTRHDNDNGNDNFLNMSTGILTIYNKIDAPPLKIKICVEMLDIISSGMGPVWITGNETTDITGMCKRFKIKFQHSFISVAKMLNNTETDSSVETDIISVQEIINPVPEIKETIPVASEKVKITLKPKPSANVRIAQYEWSYFRREKADDIHIHRVQQIMDMITSDHEYFYHSLVDTPQGVSLIEEKLKGIKSLNSQVNYCNSLCKFLELTMARHYSDFTLLRDKLNLALHQHNASRSVTSYDEIVPILQNVLTSKKSTDLKIMAMLLISIQNYESMNTGALRFSDVMNTRLTDDGEHHYLDLDNKVWILRDGYTKNKQTRSAVISDTFRDYMLSMNMNKDLPLICLSGKTTNLSKEFQKYIGINFSSVRASYVTYLDSVCDNVETIKQICNNQGHKLTTALESYRRLAETEED